MISADEDNAVLYTVPVRDAAFYAKRDAILGAQKMMKVVERLANPGKKIPLPLRVGDPKPAAKVAVVEEIQATAHTDHPSYLVWGPNSERDEEGMSSHPSSDSLDSAGPVTPVSSPPGSPITIHTASPGPQYGPVRYNDSVPHQNQEEEPVGSNLKRSKRCLNLEVLGEVLASGLTDRQKARWVYWLGMSEDPLGAAEEDGEELVPY
jgi:hypothetical protein